MDEHTKIKNIPGACKLYFFCLAIVACVFYARVCDAILSQKYGKLTCNIKRAHVSVVCGACCVRVAHPFALYMCSKRILYMCTCLRVHTRLENAFPLCHNTHTQTYTIHPLCSAEKRAPPRQPSANRAHSTTTANTHRHHHLCEKWI